MAPSVSSPLASRAAVRDRRLAWFALALGLLTACGEAATTGYTARGVVRDARDGHPLPGAEVTLSDGSALHKVETAADGAFAVPVASSSGTLTATAEGYVTATMPYSLAKATSPIVVGLQPVGPAAKPTPAAATADLGGNAPPSAR